MVKSDKNNVQAGDDLANSNMTMGLVLYLMHSPRQALLFERRPDSMYSDVAVQRSERSRSTPPPSPFIKLAQSRPQEEPRCSDSYLPGVNSAGWCTIAGPVANRWARCH
jgi:hypothetical protein